MSSVRPLPAGASLARGYEVIGHLRRGRDLDVYDVWSFERDCRCIAKVLRPDRRARPRSRNRLRAEGRLLVGLSHPHIVKAYELIERPDPIVVLETLDGETLEHMIERRERCLALADLAFLGMHMCSAMHFLHGRGYLHLDLKPSNVIADYGQAKVIDLSIARPPGRGRRGVGTAQYMAPEQARGATLGEATDVWGIGVVLFEAATGRRPWPDGLPGELNGGGGLDRPALRSLRRVPADFSELVESCIAVDPGARPRVREVSDRLDALAG
jgi:eukaryotic-like serine/threonine-protein kinase